MLKISGENLAANLKDLAANLNIVLLQFRRYFFIDFAAKPEKEQFDAATLRTCLPRNIKFKSNSAPASFDTKYNVTLFQSIFHFKNEFNFVASIQLQFSIIFRRLKIC